MIKRIIALMLCLFMLIPSLVACGRDEDEEEDPGATIRMYLSQMVYDFDPAYAFNNEAALKIVGLLFEPLFSLSEKGKVEKALVDDYEIKEDEKSGEYTMLITLNDSSWNDGIKVSADDVVYAWKRILTLENSSSAASLLFDIKNARAVKEGDASIDDLGVYAVDKLVLQITFEGKIDYDQFLLNLTSPALAPLREDIVERNADWAKKPATIVCSGPFKLLRVGYGPDSNDYIDTDNDTNAPQLVLERNPYYMRDTEKDKIGKFVAPFRIIVDFTKSPAEQIASYESGEIFYIGDIALDSRYYYSEVVELMDLMSTHTYMLNNTIAPFDNVEVRKALSVAIDREAIATAIVYAKAATALVPYGIYNADSVKKSFREIGGNLIATSANLAEAQSMLSGAGITPSDYTFSIAVHEGDEVHAKIAQMVSDTWTQLGFNCSVTPVGVIVNTENGPTGEVAKDIRVDLFNNLFSKGYFEIKNEDTESTKVPFEVIAFDFVAFSPDSFGYLSMFAKAFSGQALNMTINATNKNPIYTMQGHISGFDNEEYNAIIEEAFAEKDIVKRAVILHRAEAKLLELMPIIPIIFNQDAYMNRKDLSKIDSTYYGYRDFKKTKLKDYELHIVEMN